MTDVKNNLEYDERHGQAISNLFDLIDYLSGLEHRGRREYATYSELNEKTKSYRFDLIKKLLDFDVNLLYNLCLELDRLLTDFREQLDDVRKQKSKMTTE